MVDINDEAFLADPVLASTLSEFIEIDFKIDGLNNELVERLQHYQQRYNELKQRISQLEHEVNKLSKSVNQSAKESLKLYKQRIASNTKQLQMVRNQLKALKHYIVQLLQGSSQFKSEKGELMTKLQERVAEYRSSLKESMNEIDSHVELLRQIEDGDYKIPHDLKLNEMVFEMLDRQLSISQLKNQNQAPSWYPEQGLAFHPSENQTDEEILAQLEKLL